MRESDYSKICAEISQNLLQIQEPTKSETKLTIKKVCTKYALSRIPKNYEI